MIGISIWRVKPFHTEQKYTVVLVNSLWPNPKVNNGADNSRGGVRAFGVLCQSKGRAPAPIPIVCQGQGQGGPGSGGVRCPGGSQGGGGAGVTTMMTMTTTTTRT